MKITFLGTAAAEGWPALFCNCEACTTARIKKGKDIRTRSSALINDDFLIDLCPDTYHHALVNNLELSKVSVIAITHSHSDHFYPLELVLRGSCYAHNMKSERVDIILNDAAKEKFDIATADEMQPDILKNMSFFKPEPFVAYDNGKYKITPFPARHMPQEKAVIYMIESDGKTILYLHDTGFLYDEIYDYLKDKKIKADLVSFDCTFGTRMRDGGGHMGLEDNVIVRDRLKQDGIIDDDTILVINHFSHNANVMHEQMEQDASKFGFIVAYDSMQIEI